MELTEVISDLERQLREAEIRYYKLEGAKELIQSLLQQEAEKKQEEAKNVTPLKKKPDKE